MGSLRGVSPLETSTLVSYVPKVDAFSPLSFHRSPEAGVGPVFHPELQDAPLKRWSPSTMDAIYPANPGTFGPESRPTELSNRRSGFLQPYLTRNERLRLTMLWYYTRGMEEDEGLLSRLQERADRARDAIGWDYAIVGIFDINTYTRVVASGLPQVKIPRCESTCSHTVNSPAGTVFAVPDLLEDWRFRESPYVKFGGLRSYAGSPLRCQTDFDDDVAMGSICVAANTVMERLSPAQQAVLSDLSDWVTFDIVQSAGIRRQREKKQMAELIAKAQRDLDEADSEDVLVHILRTVYPHAMISIQSSRQHEIKLQGRASISETDLENGLWEDVAYIDHFITHLNHLDPPTDRTMRAIVSRYDNAEMPTYLVVASNRLKHVFDELDAWFVMTCAGLLSQRWQKRVLKEANLARDQFLRGITHQIRTPIHGILGSVELLAEDLERQKNVKTDVADRSSLNGLDSEETFAHINAIRTAGSVLTSVVNSLITLNRWKDISTRERTDTLESAGDLESHLSNATSKNIMWDTTQKPTLLFSHKVSSDCSGFWIDTGLFLDSVVPLILNAVQSTSKTGIVMVTISLCPEANNLIIDIEDTGCGIKADDHERIFRAFEKVDPFSHGAGLGLTLASKHAELLGGETRLVSSECNQGSHFQVTFHDIRSAWSQKKLDGPKSDSPTSFHILTSPTETSRKCIYASRYLLHQGYKQTEDSKKTLLLMEYLFDDEHRYQLFKQIVLDQVAICLVPRCKEAEFLLDGPDNLVYVREPFLTSSFQSALEEAALKYKQLAYHRTPLPQSDQTEEDYLGRLQPQITQIELSQEAPLPAEDRTLAVAVTVPDTLVPKMKSLSMSSHPKALLVDDNAINLRILQVYCRKRELLFSSATDGKQAFDQFLQASSTTPGTDDQGFELILMDLQMPICDGIEATRLIREHEKRHGLTPCILFIITGQDSPSDRAIAEEAGADEFFAKPLGMKTLDRALSRYFPSFSGS